MTYYGNNRAAYELDTKVGGGGEGEVFLLKGKPDLVAKLYRPERLKRAGERAAAASDGPGSFQTAFLDALWNTDADDVASSTIWEA